jgi:hypothetical protein
MRKSCRVILFILGVFPLISTLAFGLPGLVNYKGRLTDPLDNPVAGPVNVTFTLWDAVTGGSQLEGGFSDTDSVTPNADAIYDTLIGDDGGPLIPISVFKNDSVWLNVNVDGEDLSPRTRLTPIGSALHADDADTVDGLDASAFIKSSASAYVVVETTDNAVTNGTNLIAAYAAAVALTPNGQALGSDNRAVVLVPPGKYDLGPGQLEMNTEYVDVAGLSTLRENQHIYGTANGAGTGVLRQTANNVKIENLFVEIEPTAFVFNYDDQDPAAYFPDTALGNAVVQNCLLDGDGTSGWSMRFGIEYAGQYEDCTGGGSSFGGGFGGTASGTFNNCTGGVFSFGADGTASGTFNNCTGGDSSFAFGGTASGGKFYFCSGGTNSFTTTGSPTVIHCIQDGVAYP